MDIDPGASPELLVCQALSAATDGNFDTVRKAEAQLTEWEAHPGFFATLARIATACNTHPTATVNVRWMAAVYMKNAVNKYWRRGTRHEIPAEEKQQIRDTLLAQFAGEEVPQVALQVAVLLGRIARIDCPREWPQLMPDLLKRLQEYMNAMNSAKQINVNEQKCVLLVLHHVIKSLASRRMMAEKRVFEELSANIFGFIKDMWHAYTNLFFHQLKIAPAEAMSTLERSLLIMRSLRKLCIFGFSKPHKSEMCMSFIQELFTCLKQCLNCRFELRTLNADEQLIALLEKFIVKQMKTLLEFQETHSASFSRFVPVALDFSFNYIFHEGTSLIFTDNVINFNTFGMHCVNLMRGIMMCQTYTVATNSLPEDELCQEPSIALTDFFTDERISYICEKIVTHYFVMTQSELDSWAEDPESFAQDDGGESWKYSLRPSVERLYLACFTVKPKKVQEEISKYVEKAQQIELTSESSLKDILLKDAIYTAAGLGSFQFYHEIDFNAWFSKQLVNELRIEVDSFRILRRRIIWLVGEWTAVKFSRELRPLAYEACLHLLRPVEDMSIRLAASRTLSTLIGDFEFLPIAFTPYLEQSFNALFVLLREAKECETKMNVLNIMGLLVENMGDHIEPLAEGLISYLPALWKESEEYNMLRCAIICTLQQLVKAMYYIRDTMKSFLYNVIEHSTNVQEPSHIYLMEEGLQLWVAVIENSSTLTPPLFDMCRNLMPIIELSSEYLRTVLLLIEGYILLDAHVYLERYGPQFVNFCKLMFEDIRPEGIIMMLKVFETILKSDPNYGLELVRPALPFIFKEVYNNEIAPVQMSMHLMMVARVLLINQSVFMSILHELQLPDALETILDVWVNKMPLVTELEKRKLFCLSFASIFSNNPLLIERFPVIMQHISEAMEEVMREEEPCTDDQNGDNSKDSLHSSKHNYCDSLVFFDEHDLNTSQYSTMEDFEHKTFHYDRFRALSLKDPVHKIVLPEYIKWQLQALRQQLGNDAYQHVMQTVYFGTLQKLSRFIALDVPIIRDEH